MKRRLFALALALLLAVSLPVSALALDWYIDDGDITINATADGKQTVKQGNKDAADDDPTITQRDSSKETSNTITIDADEHTTTNVTLGGVNIDASSRGNNTAGIRTMGDGNVTIELDGNNSVKSAADATGLQKDNGGNLTIKDGNTPAGRLEATGGIGGAGIGGDAKESDSNITITGGEIIATGGNGSAGIGGGNWSSASDITITGGEVAAKGGTNGAGIGGGWNGSGGNLSVSISGDAQVKVQGGNSGHAAGAGAGIGNGGFGGRLPRANGDEVEPDTSGLTENGRLEYYTPGADMEKDYPEKVIENKPEMGAQPGASAPVYSVTDKDGNAVSYTAAREGGVLTIRVDAAYARLTLTADEAQALTAQSVEKVVFITTGATSAFRPADLTAYASEAPFVLTHDGETITFTAGETDLASLLLQA
ncbi:MAG: hypothetical protein MSA04_05135 [Clostridiales bacterium]|nr:hypothetical protein [Clostridiales bacterium]